MTDEELADELLDRLADFSPALSVGPGEDDEQVEVSITMCRTSFPELLDEVKRKAYAHEAQPRPLSNAARLSRDVAAVSTGNPKRIERRAKNKAIGRILGRAGFWRALWR